MAQNTDQAGAATTSTAAAPLSELRETTPPGLFTVHNMKLPPFWRINPSLWFAQVDAQFYAHRVRSDETKYFAVVASLDSSILQQVSDIIAAPPEDGKYETLKKELISRFTDSQDRQLRKLLTDMELGERKPSQFLREMKNLASGKIGDDVLKTLWLQRLPVRAQVVLSVSTDLALKRLAQMADKIVEISTTATVMATEVTPLSKDIQNSATSNLEELQKQVSALTLAVERLTNSTGTHRRPRSRSVSRHRSNSQASNNNF